MCRHCSADPSFRGFDLRVSPLGAPVVFAALGDLPFRRLPLGGLTFGLTASAFRHAPLRSCRSAGWPSGSRLPLFGTHHFGVAARRVGSSAFRFGVALGELVFLPSVSEMAARRVGLRAHGFRFSACATSGLPSASWFFYLPFRRLLLGELTLPPSTSGLPLGELAFGLTASAFRHAPLRSCPRRVGASASRFGDCHSASWASGSRLPLFGIRRSAPPCRRREGRRSTPTRHLFHFKTLISTC